MNEEVVSDLLRCTQVCGSRWATPKGAEGVGRCAQQATFHYLPEALANGQGPDGLEGNVVVWN